MPRISLADIRDLVFPKPSSLNFILAIAAMAFPAILIYRQNAIYFVGWDLQVYIAVLFSASIVLALLFKFWIAVSLILSLMFLPMFREAAQAMDSLWLSRFLCFFVTLYFIHFFSGKKLVLTVFLVCATVYCAFFMKTGNSKAIAFPKIEIPQELAELELKDSSSIYLFMHDAFPHKDYADYLNLPNYGELMKVLEKNGFNIYDTYSIADVTLLTMYSVFQLSTDFVSKSKNGVNTTVNLAKTDESSSRDYLRYFVSGNSIANILLKNKGYKTGISNISNRWLFKKNNIAYDFSVNDTININNVLKEVIFRGKLNDTFAGGDIDLTLDFVRFITENNNKNKIFAWTTAGPSHSSGSLNSGEAEIKRWLPAYNKALKEIQMEMDAVIKSNPNAIIIFMSDHGPYLIDVKRIPRHYDFNKTDHLKFRDIFGAFMAIRFPDREKAAKYDKKFNIVQDLFPVIFAYLFDSEIPLKYKIKNTELQLGPHKFDKGVFYPYFYSQPPPPEKSKEAQNESWQ
jgi:Ca2+/Na+ antiporter